MIKAISSSIFFVGLSLAIVGFATLTGCETSDGNPEDGKRWYEMHNCSSCHGPNGNDGRGPEIADTDLRFSSFVRKLRKGGASIMPGYSEEKIPRQDAADIYEYLKSIRE